MPKLEDLAKQTQVELFGESPPKKLPDGRAGTNNLNRSFKAHLRRLELQ